MLTCIHCENEWVLTGVRPISNLGQPLSGHAIDEHGEQVFDIACQLVLDGGVLNERIFKGIVQLEQVANLTRVDGIEVGVLPVEQLMQGEACELLKICMGQHCIIRNVGDVDLTLAVDGRSGNARRERHLDSAKAEVRGDLVDGRSESGFEFPSEVFCFDHDDPFRAKRRYRFC